VHGGLILSLTDTVGSLAVASKGQYMTGVSTNISTTFVKPGGTPGDILSARGIITGMGMSLICYARLCFAAAQAPVLQASLLLIPALIFSTQREI
jgi:acyl-coenzyme A thioesterase 13